MLQISRACKHASQRRCSGLRTTSLERKVPAIHHSAMASVHELRWDLVISGRPVQRPDVESCNAEVLQLKSVTMTMRLGDESPGKVTSEDPKLIVTILRSERQYTYHYTAVISAAANNLGQRTSVALSRFNSEI